MSISDTNLLTGSDRSDFLIEVRSEMSGRAIGLFLLWGLPGPSRRTVAPIGSSFGLAHSWLDRNHWMKGDQNAPTG